MKQRWEATFSVGPGEECSWNFQASSQQCAAEIAEALWWDRWRQRPDVQDQYPTMPRYELRMVPRPAAQTPHGDAVEPRE